jgi:hypothetical protein
MSKRATIVEGGTVPNSGPLAITTTIKQDDAAMNLTGKTVVATVRAESAPATIVDATLEDHVVALTTAASGIVTLTLSDAEMQKLSVPDNPQQTTPYLVAFKVTNDPYYPQLLRLHVHGVLD